MPLDHDPIYCAEQIVIPPDMGDILKAYAKEVIRNEPEDIFEFSAKYFAQFVTSEARISTDQLISLRQKVRPQAIAVPAPGATGAAAVCTARRCVSTCGAAVWRLRCRAFVPDAARGDTGDARTRARVGLGGAYLSGCRLAVRAGGAQFSADFPGGEVGQADVYTVATAGVEDGGDGPAIPSSAVDKVLQCVAVVDLPPTLPPSAPCPPARAAPSFALLGACLWMPSVLRVLRVRACATSMARGLLVTLQAGRVRGCRGVERVHRAAAFVGGRGARGLWGCRRTAGWGGRGG
jgi:hypothetical protein